MPRNASKDLADTKQTREERARNWGEYFRGVVREWQYADTKGERVLLSKSDLARLIKVADVTIGQWWDGKAFPSRLNCLYVATAFSKSQVAVLEAAGYVANQDDSYNTVNEIMQAVISEQGIDEAERKRLESALVVTITPDWIAANPDWIELVRVVLNQKLALMEKAARIANLVELSKQS